MTVNCVCTISLFVNLGAGLACKPALLSVLFSFSKYRRAIFAWRGAT
jgi:hypothetical protein